MGAALNGFLSVSTFWLLPSRHTPPMYCRLSLVSGFIARLRPAVYSSSASNLLSQPLAGRHNIECSGRLQPTPGRQACARTTVPAAPLRRKSMKRRARTAAPAGLRLALLGRQRHENSRLPSSTVRGATIRSVDETAGSPADSVQELGGVEWRRLLGRVAIGAIEVMVTCLAQRLAAHPAKRPLSPSPLASRPVGSWRAPPR